MRKHEPDSTKAMVLVVDDDPAVRSALRFSLQVEGYSVRDYPDGTRLLNEADLPHDGCLVIDYKLPGMNGLDVLAELRHRRVGLPAILITTHPTEAVRARAEAAGVSLIEKPLLTGALFQAIRAALDGAHIGK